ncbi:VOC family protein [Sedimentitalea sp.]|uniref:VOC family protein n=1 Tax=Sedimentitalea sp. TaxID=2048915 RepID=UPI00329A0CF8
MTNRDGTPIWYDLMTDAPEAAQDFYGAVMSWTFEAQDGAPGQDYRVVTANDGEGVGGFMKMPDGANMHPIWQAYFGVPDVDAMAERVKSLGGSIHMDPQDIPGVGRFAYVADPQGATFYLMRGDSDIDSTAFAPQKAGHCSWNELVTSDQKAALKFYSDLFGWEHGGAMPMGEMGHYTFLNHDGGTIGAVMDDFEKNAKPYWNFAMQVTDIDAAKDAVEQSGGTVRMGPNELPDNQGWLIQVTDPQGAKIMFTGPRISGAA